jgi:hypothetical protein
MSQHAASDVLALVFCRLDLVDFCSAASTCSAWHEAARKKMAWPRMVGRVHIKLSTLFHEFKPLSSTIWAFCKRISLPDMSSIQDVHLERMAVELVHVVDLSVVCSLKSKSLKLSVVCRAWLNKLVSLHTNLEQLVQACTCLRSFTLAPRHHMSGEEDWMHLLPRLALLNHIHIEATSYPISWARLSQIWPSHIAHCVPSNFLRTLGLPHS